MSIMHAPNPLQFAYQEVFEARDTIIYTLHHTYSHLGKLGVLRESSVLTFPAPSHPLLRDKLIETEVDAYLLSWITDYLTGRPQFIRLKYCVSEMMVGSTGASQGTVFSSVLFTLHTSDFNTDIVGCLNGG